MSEPPAQPVRADPAALARAASLLREGQLVAFPTETVYGLGANALDPSAVARIYEAKGRPAFNPLIVHVPDQAAARRLVLKWPEAAERLTRRYWPGPLTLVLPKAAEVPDIVTAGLGTVAVRVPSHPVALALLRAAGLPLAAPSANRSGEVSPTLAVHVARSLGNRVPLILDGGPTDLGIESTVVDLSGEQPVLLRPGMIPRQDLEDLVGPIRVAGEPVDSRASRPSPGMLDRHYAPRARLLLFDRPDGAEVTSAITSCRASGGRVGAIVRGTQRPDADLVLTLPEDVGGYARELYGALHRLDERDCSLILVQEPPQDPAWDAVRDRLVRAARA